MPEKLVQLNGMPEKTYAADWNTKKKGSCFRNAIKKSKIEYVQLIKSFWKRQKTNTKDKKKTEKEDKTQKTKEMWKK